MDVQVQVAGQITSKATRNGGTKFDIPLSNGSKPSTFDAATAQKIANFGGQTFTARLEQNGQYWNLVAAAGPGEQLPQEMPQAGASLPVAAPGATQIVQQDGGYQRRSGGSGGGGGMSPEDKIRVTKLSCISSAATTFAGSGDIDAVLEAARKVFVEVMQQAAPPQVAQAAPVAADPAAAVAFVNANAGAPVVQQGTDGVVAAAAPTALPWSNA